MFRPSIPYEFSGNVWILRVMLGCLISHLYVFFLNYPNVHLFFSGSTFFGQKNHGCLNMKSLEQLGDLELVTDQQKATDFRVGWYRASGCSFTLPCLWRVTSHLFFDLEFLSGNVFFSKGIQGWNIFQEQILEMSLWPQNVGQRRVPSPSFYILCEKTNRSQLIAYHIGSMYISM